jgi:hypothetical protein
MKLYLLRPAGYDADREDGEPSVWHPWYDKAFGFVVRAPDELTARETANTEAGDETRRDKNAWLNPRLSTCVELGADGEIGVVMRDFHAA